MLSEKVKRLLITNNYNAKSFKSKSFFLDEASPERLRRATRIATFIFLSPSEDFDKNKDSALPIAIFS
jgi:hypothetical protein